MRGRTGKDEGGVRGRSSGMESKKEGRRRGSEQAYNKNMEMDIHCLLHQHHMTDSHKASQSDKHINKNASL
jgi:hypothetical protein